MALAPSTSLKERKMKTDWDALLRFIIGVTLSLTLAGIVAVVLFSLVFVTQPMNGMAPNDEAFFNLITPLATFITGSLGTLLAMNKKPLSTDKEPS
jgi:hypothetical protein